MKSKRLLAAAVAAALSTGMLVSGTSPIFAAGTSRKTAEAPVKEQAANRTAEDDLVKVSEDTLESMRDVGSARLAIFNGLPGRARTYVDAAVTRITAAVAEADKYALDIKAPGADDRYVPFDANLTVMDTFVPSEENAKHVAKANKQLHKGEKKKAIETLQLGEIDIAVTTSVVPVKFAKEYIDKAAKLLGAGKYYEANLALKAVDDAVIVETFAFDDLPETKSK